MVTHTVTDHHIGTPDLAWPPTGAAAAHAQLRDAIALTEELPVASTLARARMLLRQVDAFLTRIDPTGSERDA